MNKIIKSLLVLTASLFTVACNLDQVGPTYQGGANGDEPTMFNALLNEVELDASLTEIGIPVTRVKTNNELTVNLTAVLPAGVKVKGNATAAGEADEKGNTTYNTSVTFAAGEAQKDLVLDISEMAVGQSYSGSVSIAEGVEVNKNFAITTTNFKLAKAYTWVSLGTGEFFCNFVGNYNEVEVLKAEGFDIYRVLNPYPGEVLTAPELGYGPAGEENGIGGAPCPYIEFWVLEDGVHIAWDEKFSTTIDYTGEGDTIWQYYPGDFNATYAPKVDNCKFLNDAKTLVQFWAVAYIDGVGGFGDKYAPCVLSLPGGPSLTEVL